MNKKGRRRIGSGMAMWLIASISVTLFMSFSASGKYRSEFSRTVDILVLPDLSAEGIPVDGAVVNDMGLGLGGGDDIATPAEETYSQMPAEATYSEIVTSTVSETASSSQISLILAEKTLISTPSAIIYPNN